MSEVESGGCFSTYEVAVTFDRRQERVTRDDRPSTLQNIYRELS